VRTDAEGERRLPMPLAMTAEVRDGVLRLRPAVTGSKTEAGESLRFFSQVILAQGAQP
jgi:hypothetical protein